METIVRGILVYVVLLALFRLSGKRALSQVTTFDLVLTLIISEAVQQALVDTDNSMTNALLLVVTLIGLDILFSLIKQRSQAVERLVDGLPLVVMERGRLHRDRMRRERVDEEDILSAGRELHGLRSLDEVDYAVVERSGGITVVPRRDADE